MPQTRASRLALVLANLVPIVGVVWFDWRVFDILILYWAENVVVGGINVLRMLACRGGSVLDAHLPAGFRSQHDAGQPRALQRAASGMRLFLIPFFAVHYGLFCFGHYTAVVSIFGDLNGGGGGPAFSWPPELWIGVAAITASHLVSFWFNYIGQGEYQRTSLRELMHRPYGRIVVMHLTVIGGGLLVTTLGNPLWMLVLLVVLKIGIDLGLHVRERSVFRRSGEMSS